MRKLTIFLTCSGVRGDLGSTPKCEGAAPGGGVEGLSVIALQSSCCGPRQMVAAKGQTLQIVLCNKTDVGVDISGVRLKFVTI